MAVSRRLVNLTLDTLEDLPRPCRQCVYWELDPVAAEVVSAEFDKVLEQGKDVKTALADAKKAIERRVRR